MKKTVKKYRLKEGVKEKVKNIFIILFIYLLFFGFLLLQAARVENLDHNKDAGKNKTLKIELKKEK